MQKKNNTGLIIGIIILLLALIVILYLIVKPTDKSNNTNLDSLVISNYPITFSKDTTTYTININEEVDSLEVTAVPEDKDSKIMITGNTDLKTGNNEINITVTAPDGTSKIYTVHVNKGNNENNIIDDDMNNDNTLNNNNNDASDNDNNNNDLMDDISDKINE